jgi:ABC-type transport system involved in cytochrome bd biosynthesis fused ATPase/permease subunit
MLSYLFTIFSVAVMGKQLTESLFGNTVMELWIIWLGVFLVLFLLKKWISYTKYK